MIPPPSSAYPIAYPSAGGFSSPAPPPGAWGASNAKNWMGIVSLVLGCVGGGVLGVIFGHMGLAACRRGEANNRGLALAGLILNYAMIGVVVLVLVIAGIVGSVESSSTPTQTSGFATQGTEATRVSDAADLASHPLDTTLTVSDFWYGLTFGDCITSFYSEEDLAEGNFVFVEPEMVPCSEPHFGEVYALAGIGGAEPPSDATFEAHYVQLCEGPAFDAYVGVSDYYESSIYYDVLYPDDSSWKDGGREMACVLVEESESTIGSLKGSGR
jgi:hypothetical protein